MSDLCDLSDSELISRCLKKESEAWEILIRRYQRLIASITAKFRLSRDDAADVFQLVSFDLFKQLSHFNRDAKLSSWLITVTVRECWKLRQKSARYAAADDVGSDRVVNRADPDEPTSEDQVLFWERQHVIRTALNQLKEPCKMLLRKLFYTEERLSYAALSADVGMPVASIGPTRARCLERLKAALEKMGYAYVSK
jgi:RNA polymerase sigma factor (sigma-70 family)